MSITNNKCALFRTHDKIFKKYRNAKKEKNLIQNIESVQICRKLAEFG